MILLQAAQVSKSFGANPILDKVSLTIQEGERSGIVGVNGAGKSTLLKVITGELEPDAGEVIRARAVSMGYLSQNGALESGNSIWQEMLSIFTPLLEMENKLREMETCMGDPTLIADKTAYRQLLHDYDNLSASFKRLGGFEYETNIRGVLHGLNFSNMDYNTPVDNLSGGQKTRLALARCLLTAPDLLILDEPTNYLDMDNLTWLEQHLQSYRGAVMVVSHDRYFLDALVKVIYELGHTRLTRYTGNYTDFVRQKTEMAEQHLKEYHKQQAEIARMEDFVRCNIAAKDTTRRAQSRQKTLEKLERVAGPVKERRVCFSFNTVRPSGQEVLRIKDLTVGYSGTPLARRLNFELSRGERVALIGPNGIGKSTLLKTIAGLLPALDGQVRLGNYVQIGYYQQEQQGLDGDKQVLYELWDRYPHMHEVEIRSVLGRFLFRGEEVKKSVADLSGGEKSRLALAALMLQRANFLLLDEPTNHLDLSSKEVLEEALAEYPGTVLFVSHDRYFINKMASRLLVLRLEGVDSYLGNYEYYLEKRAELQQEDRKKEIKIVDRGERSEEKELYLQRKEEEREKRRRQRQIEELEVRITDLEKDIARLEKELYLPEVYQNYQACQKCQNKLDHARCELQGVMEKWLALLEV